MALRNGTFGRIASRSWFDVDAYTGGWFDDDLIPPPGATPPVTPTTAPRRYPIGTALRLVTGRMR